MKLEPELHEPYKLWQKQPTLESTGRLLSAIGPHIDQAIRANVKNTNPLLRSRAKQLAIKTLHQYDPERSSMRTFLQSQFQGLKRIQRDQLNPIHVPERLAMDQGRLVEGESDLEANLGRMPTTAELADHLGMHPAKIAHLRRLSGGVPEGHFLSSTSSEDNPGGFAPPVEGGLGHMAVEMVYGDLPTRDQLILELTLGLHGRRAHSNEEIAKKLRVTPGLISQRKSVIQSLLDRMEAIQ
jgi:DNA-directed RNA polymerase specialized sigma subunit